MATRTEGAATVSPPSLVALLGPTRAAIVDHLRSADGATVGELAGHLDISEVATRRHLAVLEDDGLVAAEVVRRARGRPAARYRLTDAAGRLLPQRYDELAGELFTFLEEEHGREGLRAFLRWRMWRETERLGEAVTAEDLHERLDQLADALSRAGFDASVTSAGHSFTLVQGHCAIEDVARDHPEVCAYEAASFSRVLGHEVSVSRRETLAGGAPACVCTIEPREDAKRATAHDDDNRHRRRAGDTAR